MHIKEARLIHQSLHEVSVSGCIRIKPEIGVQMVFGFNKKTPFFAYLPHKQGLFSNWNETWSTLEADNDRNASKWCESNFSLWNTDWFYSIKITVEVFWLILRRSILSNCVWKNLLSISPIIVWSSIQKDLLSLVVLAGNKDKFWSKI